MQTKVAIIGGGIAGLSCALELQRQGAQVHLFETHQVGQATSYCAAGMITPVGEIKFGEERLLELFLSSLELYPEFISKLCHDPKDIDFRTQGSLMIAVDADDEEDLERIYTYQKKLNLKVERLSQNEIKKKEPYLSQEIHSAIFCPQEYSLDNKAICAVIKKQIVSLGGKILENCPVQDIIIKNGTALGIIVKSEKMSFDHILLASGTSIQFPSLDPNLIPEIRGVKGQALALRMSKEIQISHTIRSFHKFPVYLVPRSDGRLLIGASMEEIESTSVHAGQIMDLLYGAWRIFPATYEFELVETWAGLRPASRNHQPILGPSSIGNLSFALGLYRHGFLLAPIVSKLVSESILKKASSELIHHFTFQGPQS